jgi:TIR domain
VRIFLSYDDTRRDVAQRLALGLRVARHRVFFDQDSLPAGTSYDDRIRRAILRSHLFVFLISRESISTGAYALTELAIAEERWRHPTGRVLPVLLDDTPIPSLPPYLRAVSVLVPRGDVVADILNAVARLDAERRRGLLGRIGAGTIGALGVAAAIAFSGLLSRNGAPGEDGPAADSIAPAESVAPDTATADPAQSSTAALDDGLNPRTWKLKNGRHVRLVGGIVANESNVADNIVIDAVEFSAWRYNRCYDDAYGHLAADLPEGAVIVAFEIRDQLPRAGSVERSDFTGSDFDECVVGTLIGHTINAAGAAGAGRVTYSFRFLPN